MYNILINNLSLVASAEINTYKLITEHADKQNETTQIFNGIYTNEPVTQVFIRKFANEEQGEKLDSILSLTTTKVKTNIFDLSKINPQTHPMINDISKYLNIPTDKTKSLTHYSFYETAIRKTVSEEYALQTEEEINDFMPFLDSVPIPNIPEAADIHMAVIKLAEKIIHLYNLHPEGCRLYMDYTGGDRSTSTVIIALTKMLENRGIHITQILAVNFDREAPIKEIRNKIEVNYIFDFISGLHEFNNYGNAHTLTEFFNKSIANGSIKESDQARRVLKKIQHVADQIQMCRSSKMVSSIGELVNAIDDYEKYDTAHDSIFDYLIHDIKNNYSGVYLPNQRTILNIIRWCLEKNLIQQAVTMYAELLPQVLVDQHIIEYDRKNWNTGTNEVHDYWKNGKNNYSKYSEKYAYINYYIGLEIADRAGCKHKPLTKEKVNKIVNYIFSTQSIYAKVKPGIRPKQLTRILLNYWQFKSLIRHPLNHASSNDINIGKIRSDMYWEDGDSIFLDHEGNQITSITVATLSTIITNLLNQLESVGIR